MSKNKEFSNTSAERYSLALYELAKEYNSLEIVEQHTSAILKLLNLSKDFNNFLKDPTINKEDLISVIDKISAEYKINNLLKIQFIRVINFLLIYKIKSFLIKESCISRNILL